jgi:hypothetical protein
MKKALLFTVATFFLFSTLFSLIILNFNVGKASNVEFNHRLFAFRVAYQSEIVEDMVEDSLNQRFSFYTDENYVYLTMSSSLDDGMNPNNNLNNLDSFLSDVYGKKVVPNINHDFTEIYSDLSSNRYERDIEPYGINTVFNYGSDEMDINNVDVIESIGFDLDFEGATSNISWSVQSGDLLVNINTPTKASSKYISKNSDGYATVSTTKGNLVIQFNFASSDNIKVKYNGVYEINLETTMKLAQTQKNLFKVTSPYTSIINMSLGDYSIIKGLD